MRVAQVTREGMSLQRWGELMFLLNDYEATWILKHNDDGTDKLNNFMVKFYVCT